MGSGEWGVVSGDEIFSLFVVYSRGVYEADLVGPHPKLPPD